MEKAKGNQYTKDAPSNGTREQKTLSQLGISKDQSASWQQLGGGAARDNNGLARADKGHGPRLT
jgi:hypothetical protein